MDGYQLFADLFKSLVSLAWPAAFVAAVWLFREKLTELMPLLRLKYKDLDVSFRLDQAEKEADALTPPAQPSQPTEEETDKFMKLADISPRAAIQEMRTEVDEAVHLLFKTMVYTGKPGNSVLDQIRFLRLAGIIDKPTSALLDDLRKIGNTARHDTSHEFTKDDAVRYRALVERLLQQFSEIAPHYKQGRPRDLGALSAVPSGDQT